jgi:hypothetical protein
MSLVPLLLRAIMRADGDALVMRIGEKPYVVAGAGNVELATLALSAEDVARSPQAYRSTSGSS